MSFTTYGAVALGLKYDGRFDEEKQWATFEFKDSVPAGSEAQLTVVFTGILNDKMAGAWNN